MRLVSYLYNGQPRAGVLTGHQVNMPARGMVGRRRIAGQSGPF